MPEVSNLVAPFSWRRGRTLVMGVVNVTPDSFSGDGLATADDLVERAVAQARRFQADGADIIDVGGESTRPNAAPVDEATELARVLPVIEAIGAVVDLPLSIDTTKAAVADAALACGARIVNDVTGLQGDRAMADVVARRGAAVIAMHTRGNPRTMQRAPRYDDLIGDIRAYLERSVEIARLAGVPAEAIAVDPGIGFGKTLQHNLEILRRLPELRIGEHGLVVGTSRKSFIGRVLGAEPDDRVEGTAATVALAVSGGADVVRVHDVRAMVRVAKMADAVVRGYLESSSR